MWALAWFLGGDSDYFWDSVGLGLVFRRGFRLFLGQCGSWPVFYAVIQIIFGTVWLYDCPGLIQMSEIYWKLVELRVPPENDRYAYKAAKSYKSNIFLTYRY